MAARPQTVCIDFESRMEILEAIQAFVDRLAAVGGLDEDGVHDLSVSVRECVVNALKHGNKLDPAKRVTVTFGLQAGAIEVWIQDQGEGFNPDGVPDATAPENLLNAAGRGLFFMRAFMSEVEYLFPPEGGTVVRLLKKVEKAQHS
ncbi:MAG: ATP-binding protein [Vicinamibacteria bacterium]|nr:ATP-binding protein [Vicinamibacteria bacterium]